MRLRLLRWLGVALGLALGMDSADAREVNFRGLLDLVLSERNRAFDLNLLTRGDSPYDPYGLRLFAAARVHDRLQVFTQVVLHDATTPYVDGAYLMFSPIPERDLHVQAGKIPWPIGTYGPRTYSTRNPLVGTPLMYQYHSTLVWYEIPPHADALLATAGSGQYGIDYFGYQEGRGMPIVDDGYWDVGLTVAGSQRPFEYSGGVTAGTPGWGSTSQDENSGKSMLGRLGWLPWPGVRLGFSGAFGPYLHQSLNPLLPAGRIANDYHQKLAMVDLEVAAGHFELRAEGARNVWQTPTVGNLDVSSGYVELKVAFAAGAFAAGRWDALRFGDIRDSTGAARPWDWNITRWEAGLGYRFTRDVVGKFTVQRNRTETEGRAEEYRDASIAAAQLSVSF